MASSLSRSGGSAGPTLPQHLAAVCSSFEEDWKEGRRPRIEEVLERTRPFDRTTLLPHLIRIEVRHRVRLGETPRPDEYFARFPSNRDTIVEIDWQSLTPREPTAEAGNRAEAVASTIIAAPARRGAIGRYELIDRLGAGGFGEVWRAFDSHLQREVAVKIGHFDAADRSQAALLLHEARSAGRLRHPRIVPIHEAGTEGDVTYIVSDYIPGTNLATKLKSGPLPAKEAAGIALKLAEALAHAHDRGIVHRDVKPANVLIDPAGEPHLTDFGVARRAAGDKTISQVGQALGTPAYMSPEQANGDTAAVDHRSDIYSLGLVLYEMLAGRRAYPGDAREVFNAVLLGPPERLRSVAGGVLRDLETIVEVATARDRSDRYPTASALAEDLGHFLRGEPVTARRIGLPSRGWRLLKRRPVASVLLAAALAMTAALPGLASRWRPTPAAETEPSDVNPGDSHVTTADGTEAEAGAATKPPALRRLVQIQTVPEDGVHVWMFPRDSRTGEIRTDRRIPPDSYFVSSAADPVEAELEAGGEYLVVADLGGGRFVEVERRVPLPDEFLPPAEIPSLAWESTGGRAVRWQIKVPPKPNSEGLAYVTGGEFVVGRGRFARRVIVPPFYVAREEFTLDDYENVSTAARAWQSLAPQAPSLPEYLAGVRLEGDGAIPLSPADADRILAAGGYRLLDEMEWLYLVTRDTPREPSTPDPEALGTDDKIVIDGSAVYDLRRGLKELTNSWAVPLSWDDPSDGAPFSSKFERITDPLLPGSGEMPVGRPRIVRSDGEREAVPFLHLPVFHSDVGFRAARSVHPRSRPHHFVRFGSVGADAAPAVAD